MPRSLILVLLLVAAAVATARGQAAAEYHYDLGGNDFLTAATPLPGGALALGGTSFNPGGGVRAHTLLLHPDGRVDTSWLLGGAGARFAAALLTDYRGSLYQLGRGLPLGWDLYRTDLATRATTARGWTTAGENDLTVRTLINLPERGLLVAGRDARRPAGVLSRLLADGTERFRLDYVVPEWNGIDVNELVAAADGSGYLFSGVLTVFWRPLRRFVGKLSPAGELLWSRTFDYGELTPSNTTHEGLVELADGTVVMLGGFAEGERTGVIVTALTAAGELAYCRSLYHAEQSILAKELRRLPDGSLFLLGALRPPGDNAEAGLACRLSPAGRPLVARRLRAGVTLSLSHLLPAAGGGYWLAGEGSNCANDEKDLVLLRVDAELGGLGCRSEEITLAGGPLPVVLRREGSVRPRPGGARPPDGVAAPARAVVRRARACEQPRVISRLPAAGPCYPEALPVLALPGGGALDSVTVRLAEPAGGGYLSLPGVVAEAGRLTLRAGPDLAGRLAAITYSNPAERAAPVRERIVVELSSGCRAPTRVVLGLDLPATAPPTLPPALDTALCLRDGLEVGARPEPGVAYVWADGTPGARRRVSAAGTYRLSAKGPCAEAGTVFTVREATGAPPRAVRQRVDLCEGDSLVVPLGLEPGTRLGWDNLGGDAGAEITEGGGAVRIFRAGVYSGGLTNGCHSAPLRIEATTRPCCRVFLPGAFSPNGDGTNDRFAPASTSAGCAHLGPGTLDIFDRWGHHLFRDGSGAGWDGRTATGRPAAPGTYIYRYSYFDGRETVTAAGSLQLLR